MKRIIFSTVLVIAAAAIASAQEFRPIPNPPKQRTLLETLRAAGNFKTFLSLFEPEYKNLGFAPAGTKAGPGGGPLYQTIFVPNDFAFAQMPPAALDSLRKDPARRRAFLLAHIVPARVLVADLLTPIGDGTSRTFKELKSRQGRVLGFECNGHTGAHYPRINGGKARVGKMQDVLASDYLTVIHEVDAVLIVDGSV